MRDPVARTLARVRVPRTGLVVSVWRGRDRVDTWHRGHLPAGADTLFEIGSITKVFTATLLTGMTAAGEVDVDDPVQRHLPSGVEMPSRGRDITLADLASHRSGLPALPRGLLVPALTTRRRDPYARWDARRLEAAIPRTHPRRSPGERFRYSNYGVGLLGHALSLRARTSYDELIQQRICAPLGLADTGVSADDGRLAGGHTRRGRPTPHWHLGALAGAGGLRSTARDLVTFLRLHADPPLTPLALAARETHRPRIRVGRGHVGLGWLILPATRRVPYEVLSHEGGTGGFRSFAAVVPEARVAVVVLSNHARSVGWLGLRLLAALIRPRGAPAGRAPG